MEMKTILEIRTFFPTLAFALFVNVASAQEGLMLTEDVETLTEQVQQACPKVWEDLGTKIDEDIVSEEGTIWGLEEAGETDMLEYSAFLAQLTDEDSTQSSTNEEAFADIERIMIHCTTARTALLSMFYSNLPQEVVASMPELTYEPGPPLDGFLIGDIRHTGRREAAEGWLFMTGQTIGSVNSTATLKGSDYRDLYEIAKYWAGNEGDNEVWADGDAVQLPNLNGRVVAGASTDKIGTLFGNSANTISLTTSHLPTHSHSANTVASHKHGLGSAGNHGHQLYSSAYDGSGAPRNWSYFEGKARTNFQNHILHATRTAGNHTHSVGNAGAHTHTIGDTGNGAEINIAQPSVQFMIEIKYKH